MPKPIASLDLSPLKKPLDLWFARYSTGFKGTAVKGKKGYEHHKIRRSGNKLVVESVAGFDNWGTHTYRAKVTAAAAAPPVGEKAELSTATGKIVSSPATAGGKRVWRSHIKDADVDENRDRPFGDDLVPSLVARFLPLLLPRERGVTIAFTVISEDAGRTMFPLILRPGPRKLVCTGPAELKTGRTSVTAVRFEHRAGKDVAGVTWIGEDGAFLRHEQPGCVIVATTKALALDGVPRELVV